MLFSKPCKVKTNRLLKGSEGRALLTNLSLDYPALTKEKLKETLPPKEPIGLMVVILSSGESVLVYTRQNVPIAFFYKDRLYPTLFLLWMYPECIPSITIHEGVLGYLQKGADCMLPGIQNPAQYVSNKFKKGDPVYINTSSNRAAVAVGVTALSSTEMGRVQTGKAVLVYHILGDKLCADIPGPRPYLGAPDSNKPPEPPEVHVLPETLDKLLNLPEADEDDMDKLLLMAFLTAVKYSKDLTLPIPASTFYKKHMLSVANSDKLDLKKSSYKKLGKFLDEMCDQGVIETKEVVPGALSITKVNRDNKTLANFHVDKDLRPQLPPKENKSTVNVSMCYKISSKIAPLFQHSNYSRKQILFAKEVRDTIVEYVKKESLTIQENPGFVQVDPCLSKLFNLEIPTIAWDALMQLAFDQMELYFTITKDGVQNTYKGKPKSIELTTHKCGSNKSMTVITNAQLYGINLVAFREHLQLHLQASTVLDTAVNVIKVQGNQVVKVRKLLQDKYDIPKQYISDTLPAKSRK